MRATKAAKHVVLGSLERELAMLPHSVCSPVLHIAASITATYKTGTRRLLFHERCWLVLPPVMHWSR